MATYVDMLFIRCTEEEAYTTCLALIEQNSLELIEAAPFTHSLEYVTLSSPCGSLHPLTNFNNCWKEIQFEQQFRARSHAALFIT